MTEQKKLQKTNIISKIKHVDINRKGIIRNDIKNFAAAELSKEMTNRQRDLLYFTDIYVSEGWNANDDIFLKDELLKAWDTISLKPVDFEHVAEKIIGVMYDSDIVDKNGNKITADDALKSNEEIDIISHSVIYKWLFPEEAELIRASADINSDIFNKYAVSMECYFKKYDFGIEDGKVLKIIENNEKTNFLESYLRWNGGKGYFNGKKIGRVLRDILFAGKGIVKNPANDESVIMCAAQKMPEVDEDRAKQEENIVLANIKATVTKIDINKENKLEVNMAEKELIDRISLLETEITGLRAAKTELEGAKSLLDEIDSCINEEFKEEEEAEAAKWDVKYINDLPDAAFAIIKAGGEKDEGGNTVPRTLRMLPHHTAGVTDPNDNDTVDVIHLRNALARAGQPKTNLTPAERKRALGHLNKHAKALLKIHKEAKSEVIETEVIKEKERNKREDKMVNASAAPETGVVAPVAVVSTTIAPEIVTPAVVAPEVVAPAAVAPEVVAPAAVAPEVVAPAAVAPEVVAPAAVAPEVVAPAAVAPEVVAPAAVAPEVVAPAAVAPEVPNVTVLDKIVLAPGSINLDIQGGGKDLSIDDIYQNAFPEAVFEETGAKEEE